MMLDNVTQGELTRYGNNYNALNLNTTVLDRDTHDRVSHLEIIHDMWFKLCNIYESSSDIKSTRKDTYSSQYQIFSQKTNESLDDCFAKLLTQILTNSKYKFKIFQSHKKYNI
jgi:hypothetical protein